MPGLSLGEIKGKKIGADSRQSLDGEPGCPLSRVPFQHSCSAAVEMNQSPEGLINDILTKAWAGEEK